MMSAAWSRADREKEKTSRFSDSLPLLRSPSVKQNLRAAAVGRAGLRRALRRARAAPASKPVARARAEVARTRRIRRGAARARLALDGAERFAAVARDERDRRAGHLDDGAVGPVLGAVDDGLARACGAAVGRARGTRAGARDARGRGRRALLDEPAEVVLAAAAVLLVADLRRGARRRARGAGRFRRRGPREARELADVLDDAARCRRELAARRALGAERVGEVVAREHVGVAAPAVDVRVACTESGARGAAAARGESRPRASVEARRGPRGETVQDRRSPRPGATRTPPLCARSEEAGRGAA